MRSLSAPERQLVTKVNAATSITNIRGVARGRASSVSLRHDDFERAGVALSGPTLHRALDDTFTWMYRHHRSERLYKSVIARKLLKGRHSLRSSALVSEFRIADSIADCVIVNGDAHVYEIKTELDDPSKLQKQIRDYRRAFTLVTVVTHESLADRYLELVDDARVGVLALSVRGRLSSKRPAQARSELLDVGSMFAALRQHEYIDIETRLSGTRPECRPVDLFATYRSLALEHEPTTYAVEFERQLRARRALLPDTLAEEAFEPVLSQCASINPTALQAGRIRRWLESEVD